MFSLIANLDDGPRCANLTNTPDAGKSAANGSFFAILALPAAELLTLVVISHFVGVGPALLALLAISGWAFFCSGGNGSRPGPAYPAQRAANRRDRSERVGLHRWASAILLIIPGFINRRPRRLDADRPRPAPYPETVQYTYWRRRASGVPRSSICRGRLARRTRPADRGPALSVGRLASLSPTRRLC